MKKKRSEWTWGQLDAEWQALLQERVALCRRLAAVQSRIDYLDGFVCRMILEDVRTNELVFPHEKAQIFDFPKDSEGSPEESSTTITFECQEKECPDGDSG